MDVSFVDLRCQRLCDSFDPRLLLLDLVESSLLELLIGTEMLTITVLEQPVRGLSKADSGVRTLMLSVNDYLMVVDV